jgi:hypothetical protein
LTVSDAPTTSATSVESKSSLISSISSTRSYGTPASASTTFSWPGMRPATGWMPKRTFRGRDATQRDDFATVVVSVRPACGAQLNGALVEQLLKNALARQSLCQRLVQMRDDRRRAEW